MIETCRLKNVVIFIQAILSFVLSRKIINIYNNIAHKTIIVIDILQPIPYLTKFRFLSCGLKCCWPIKL